GGFNRFGGVGMYVGILRIVRHALARGCGNLLIERGGRLVLRALPRDFRVLVFMLGVARRAPGLLHIGADHRDYGMVGDAPLARTVIIQNVTKAKLALLHPNSLPRPRRYRPRWRVEKRERWGNVSKAARNRPASAEPPRGVQRPRPATSIAA